jgi:hypothetical protein
MIRIFISAGHWNSRVIVGNRLREQILQAIYASRELLGTET